MGLRSTLGQGRRRLRETFRWLRHEFPKSPGFELYARHIDRDNAALTQSLRTGGPEAFQSYIAPYLNRDIPRILWIFWAQGEEAAPSVVKTCIASWRRLNPDWDIRVLDNATAEALVDLSDLPPQLPARFRANLLRLRLLARQGGVWTDATTLCHRPLDDWLPLLAGQTGFFVFASPHSDRWISNWFIAAHPENPIISAWSHAYGRYLTRLKVKPGKYFMMIYALQWQLLRNRALMTHFRRRGSLPAVPCFLLQAALEQRIDASIARSAIHRGLPLSKLSWKSPATEEGLARWFADAGKDGPPETGSC